MDGLSAAASGMAVVSLAVQMAESFKKAHDFWSSIKDAPEDIRIISQDLRLLSSILAQAAKELQHIEPDDVLIAAMEGCSSKVRSLTSIMDEIEAGLTARKTRQRRWTSFKAVLKKDRIAEYQVSLERLKTSLMLAQQTHHR